MKKLILILLFAIAFLAAVNATTYCESSVKDIHPTNYSYLGIGGVSNTTNCVCYGATEKLTDWKDEFCLKGEMHQSQVRQFNQPSTCNIVSETKYRDIADERCKLCEGKEILGDWKNVECKEDGRVLQSREIEVNTINPLTSDCEMKNMIEFKYIDESLCKIPVVNEAITGKIGTNTIIAILVVLVILGYVFRSKIKRFI